MVNRLSGNSKEYPCDILFVSLRKRNEVGYCREEKKVKSDSNNIFCIE